MPNRAFCRKDILILRSRSLSRSSSIFRRRAVIPKISSHFDRLDHTFECQTANEGTDQRHQFRDTDDVHSKGRRAELSFFGVDHLHVCLVLSHSNTKRVTDLLIKLFLFTSTDLDQSRLLFCQRPPSTSHTTHPQTSHQMYSHHTGLQEKRPSISRLFLGQESSQTRNQSHSHHLPPAPPHALTHIPLSPSPNRRSKRHPLSMA